MEKLFWFAAGIVERTLALVSGPRTVLGVAGAAAIVVVPVVLYLIVVLPR